MKVVLVCITALFALRGLAQKVVSKSVDFPIGIVAQIDARQCYELQLESWQGSEMVVVARMEGEYAREALLRLEKEGSTLILSAGLDSVFRIPDDKLGAHKVVSIALKVRVPEDRKVSVLANATQLSVRGIYEHLRVMQAEGFCGIYGVRRSVEVHTQSANIYVASSGASIEATSKYGKVFPNEIPSGEPHFELHTILGNINLVRTE